MPPKFAIAESPDLARAVRAAGFDVLTDDVEARQVAEAIRSSGLDARHLLVITPAHTPTLRAWVQSLAAAGRKVAVLGNSEPIPRTAQVKLPASINDILSVFKAPRRTPFDEWILNPDLTVSEPVPEDDATFWDSIDPDWDDDEPMLPETPEAEELPPPAPVQAPAPVAEPPRPRATIPDLPAHLAPRVEPSQAPAPAAEPVTRPVASVPPLPASLSGPARDLEPEPRTAPAPRDLPAPTPELTFRPAKAPAQVILVSTSKGGTGKAEPLTNRIPVPASARFPSGWAIIGEIQVGDQVYAADGSITTVLGLSPIEHRECFDLHLSDGQVVRASDHHLWKVSSAYSREQQAPVFERPRAARRQRYSDKAEHLRSLAADLGPDHFIHTAELSRISGASAAHLHRALPESLRQSVPKQVRHRDGSITTLNKVVWPADEALMLLAKAREDEGNRSPAGKTVAPLETVVDTQHMFANKHKMSHGKPTANWAIRTAAPIRGLEADLPVAPYTLGAWLGDGTSTSGNITSADPEIIEAIRADGYEVVLPDWGKASSGLASVYRIQKLLPQLRALGVLANKHIPAQYLRASSGQRLALLQGLMDTDGSVSATGMIELSASNEVLAHQVLELVRSLGIKASMTSRMGSYTKQTPDGPVRIETQTSWRIVCTTTMPVVRLSRKAERLVQQTRPTQDWLYVTDITPAGVEPVRCLTVDHPEHLYLTAGFVPTHNSSVSVSLAETAAANGVAKVVLIDGNRGQGDVRKYLRITKPVPSIYDAAVADDPRGAITPPKMLNAARDQRLPELHFGLVSAPRAGQVDSSVVDADFYSRVVDAARDFADLVIIDTQISEEEDTSGLWDRAWLPLFRAGAWGLGVSNGSTPSIENMLERFGQWTRAGVPTDRMLVAMNMVPAETLLDVDKIQQMFGHYATGVGIVRIDERISQAFEVGRIPDLNLTTEFAAALYKVLHVVTGLDVFADPPRSTSARGKGLFRRKDRR